MSLYQIQYCHTFTFSCSEFDHQVMVSLYAIVQQPPFILKWYGHFIGGKPSYTSPVYISHICIRFSGLLHFLMRTVLCFYENIGKRQPSPCFLGNIEKCLSTIPSFMSKYVILHLSGIFGLVSIVASPCKLVLTLILIHTRRIQIDNHHNQIWE